MMDDLGAAVDPTIPERWRRVRPWGRAGVIAASIVAAGIPAAIVLDLALLVLRGDRDLLLSLRHAMELMAVIWVVAPLVGVLIGDALWARGEARTASGGS